ncbi:hypothetical protein ACG74X_07785 [Marivita sp. S0852]|uniref:hypothetical protein n=1 Tax=Marivita sp. S0852 TaxID=3373893 RepID=UPI003982CE66
MTPDTNAALLEAHDRGDLDALVSGYMAAADSASDHDAACFFLTHAYVFALEAGDAREDALRAKLAENGRI